MHQYLCIYICMSCRWNQDFKVGQYVLVKFTGETNKPTWPAQLVAKHDDRLQVMWTQKHKMPSGQKLGDLYSVCTHRVPANAYRHVAYTHLLLSVLACMYSCHTQPLTAIFMHTIRTYCYLHACHTHLLLSACMYACHTHLLLSAYMYACHTHLLLSACMYACHTHLLLSACMYACHTHLHVCMHAIRSHLLLSL